jgi:hypothetical protein
MASAHEQENQHEQSQKQAAENLLAGDFHFF